MVTAAFGYFCAHGGGHSSSARSPAPGPDRARLLATKRMQNTISTHCPSSPGWRGMASGSRTSARDSWLPLLLAGTEFSDADADRKGRRIMYPSPTLLPVVIDRRYAVMVFLLAADPSGSGNG